MLIKLFQNFVKYLYRHLFKSWPNIFFLFDIIFIVNIYNYKCEMTNPGKISGVILSNGPTISVLPLWEQWHKPAILSGVMD